MAVRDRADWNRSVFATGGRTIAVGDVIVAAHFRGELQPVWTGLLLQVEREKQAADLEEGEPDEAALQALSEQFRYERDLITVEETERWLEARGLTLEDFDAYFLRHYWADALDEPTEPEPEALDYRSASDELWDLLRAELQFSGELDRMARQLSWRFAAAQAERDPPAPPPAEPPLDSAEPDDASSEDWPDRLGCEPRWLDTLRDLETTYRRHCDRLWTPERLKHSLVSLRLRLTRIELETIDLESLDATREAILCVREDGASMSEVAADGGYPYQRTEMALEDLPAEIQQKLLSAVPGDLLEPFARDDGFQLSRLVGKTEPDLADRQARDRVKRHVLERHFSELSATCVRWLLAPTVTS
jgi:hypothetical protein